MKIALLPSAFFPSLGGVEELTRQLAHALVRRGHEVTLLTMCWPRDLPEFEEFEGLPLHRLVFYGVDENPRSRVKFALNSQKVQRQTEAILRDFGADLAHVQCVSVNAFYARRAAQKLNIPLVLTAQGERTMDATGIYERSKFLNDTLRACLDEAPVVTACSRDTLEDLERYHQPLGERGHVVYNGIRLADWNHEPHVHTRKGVQRPYFFALGRFVPQKGFDVLLRAFAEANLTDLDFILAGDGSEKEALHALARELKIEDRVVFWGRADRAQVASLMRGAEFFVLPSRHEPQGIVNLEAMACERPVIATRVGGVPEIVTEEVGILVPPDNSSALAAAMRAMMNDPHRRQTMGQAARRHAEAFDWDAIAAQYEALYEVALRSRIAKYRP